jgi:dTDP-4-dehydrorhamnose reductase
MRVVLIGANGQLACDLRRVMGESPSQYDIIGLLHSQIEVSDPDSVRRALTAHKPRLVINTAAFHKVDVCEDEPVQAFAVNAIGPRNIALACRDLDCAVVHMSTDYIFSGEKCAPHVEGDPTHPVNIYGITKVAGEMALRYLWSKHFIVRTSGLYGIAGSSGKGGNFVELMLRLASEGKSIYVVDDQTLTPTYTCVLARQIVTLVRTRAFGTYHATCQGECTWYQFAAEIFRQSGMKPELLPQTTAQSGARAKRPAYSVLENAGLQQLGIDEMPDWQDALEAYLQERERVRRSA